MNNHQTQWAAQFAAAAELCRRNYAVPMFLGNQPHVDCLCQAVSSGESFSVQIKGAILKPPVRPSAHGDWVLCKTVGGQPDDIFIVVYVAPAPELFRFFIARPN